MPKRHVMTLGDLNVGDRFRLYDEAWIVTETPVPYADFCEKQSRKLCMRVLDRPILRVGSTQAYPEEIIVTHVKRAPPKPVEPIRLHAGEWYDILNYNCETHLRVRMDHVGGQQELNVKAPNCRYRLTARKWAGDKPLIHPPHHPDVIAIKRHVVTKVEKDQERARWLRLAAKQEIAREKRLYQGKPTISDITYFKKHPPSPAQIRAYRRARRAKKATS